MDRLILLALPFIAIAVLIAQVEPSSAPPAPVAAPTPTADPDARYRAAQAAANRGNNTEILRDGSGQFHLTARVNGADTEFLVDTGADVVALTMADAQRLGIPVDPASFQPLLRTASGTGRGAIVELRNFEVAGHEFRGVSAMVIEGLPVNLLGQSVLRRFGSLELRGDKMVIRPS
jgi:aspartyl protease family protein